MWSARAALLTLMLVALAGCGGGDSTAKTPEGPTAASLRKQLGAATDPGSVRFPAVRGRSLQQVGDAIGRQGPEAVPATTVLEPGRNRLAFGVIQDDEFVYGPTVVYVARSPEATAQGPFPAPADLLVTEKRDRSQQAATEGDAFAAVYAATVPLPRRRRAVAIAVTKVSDGLIVAPLGLRLRPPEGDQIPDVGAALPAGAHTETLDDTRGDRKLLDTRVPPDPMHEDDVADVVGKRPVAVLFATPQLCQSRVCGPVTDIELQLRRRYGDRMTFIHQEVYVDNDPAKGVRAPLQRFGLPTEPWLFVFDRDGKVAARLEGSFGLRAFESAVRAGLR